jgi:hypothetical protein
MTYLNNESRDQSATTATRRGRTKDALGALRFATSTLAADEAAVGEVVNLPAESIVGQREEVRRETGSVGSAGLIGGVAARRM